MQCTMFGLPSTTAFTLANNCNNHHLHYQDGSLIPVDNTVCSSGPTLHGRYQGYDGATCCAFVCSTTTPRRPFQHPRQQGWKYHHHHKYLVHDDDTFLDPFEPRIAQLRGGRFFSATARSTKAVFTNRHRHRRRQRLYQSRRSDQDDSFDDRTGNNNNNNVVEQWIDRLVGSTSTTTSSLILYPTLIAASSLVFPLSTSILFLFLYFAYSYLGCRIIYMDDGDDYDRDDDHNDKSSSGRRVFDESDGSSSPALAVNFVAFGAALLSAGILTPLSTTDNVVESQLIVVPSSVISLVAVPFNIVVFVVVGGIAVGIVSIFLLQQKQERRLMNTNATLSNVKDGRTNTMDHRDDDNNDTDEKQLDPATLTGEKRLMELWDEQFRQVAASAIDDDDDDMNMGKNQ